MNVLLKARLNADLTHKWIVRARGATFAELREIEATPNERLTYPQFLRYAHFLGVPVGALFDEECSIAIKRGALVQAYRHALTLEEDVKDQAILNRVLMLKRALERAMIDLAPANERARMKLTPYPELNGTPNRLGRIAENPVLSKLLDFVPDETRRAI